MSKKSIVIIGAGISGMSAGIYALQSGFDVTILEKNPSVGGFCTGWYREGRYIDGCIHWLTGSKENTILNEMWKNVGAFESQEDFIYLPSFGSFETDGHVVTFWRDLDKAEKEWINISPIDKKQIHRFFKKVRDFSKVELPLDLPLSMMPLSRLIKLGLNVLRIWPSYLLSMTISTDRYAKKFKSKAIREAIKNVQPGAGNLFSMIYSYNTVVIGDGGIPKGGSKAMSERIKKRFLSLGGNLLLNTEAKEILTKDGKVIGVKTKEDEVYTADYYISCLDPNYVLTDLFSKSVQISNLEKRYFEPIKYSSPSCVLLNFECDEIKDITIPYSIECDPISIGGTSINRLNLRSYGYDKNTYLNKKNNKVLLQVLLDQSSINYLWWKNIVNNKELYIETKRMIGEMVKERIIKRFPEISSSIHLLDVATPYTLKRYCNASRGAYMGYYYAAGTTMFKHSGKLHHLSNFYLSGQWMQCPGGLPLALAMGQFAVQRVCKKEKLNYHFVRKGIIEYQ